jgi:hemin uptake protein HemP
MTGHDAESPPMPEGPLAEAGRDGARRAGSAETRAVPMVGAQLDSRDLFASGRRVVTIAHGDQLYQLRLTNQNKLILTK